MNRQDHNLSDRTTPATQATRYCDVKQSIDSYEPLRILAREEVRIYTPQSVGGRIGWNAMLAAHDLRLLLPEAACADSEPDTIRLRVALALHVGKGTGTIALDSARWIYEGGPIPRQLVAYYAPYAKRPQGKHIRGKRKRVKPQDVQEILGLKITTPHCTSRELALDYEILEPVIR